MPIAKLFAFSITRFDSNSYHVEFWKFSFVNKISTITNQQIVEPSRYESAERLQLSIDTLFIDFCSLWTTKTKQCWTAFRHVNLDMWLVWIEYCVLTVVNRFWANKDPAFNNESWSYFEFKNRALKRHPLKTFLK